MNASKKSFKLVNKYHHNNHTLTKVMNSMNNPHTMHAARDEYERQLGYILAPLLYQGVQSIYEEDAVQNSTRENVLRVFQELLLEIPEWNESMIQTECKRISDTCDWIYELITAVFVINVKILTSVKLIENERQFNLKMPTLEAFIHAVYIEIARAFFHNTHLMYYENSHQKHKQRSKAIKLIRECISDTVRSKLPIRSILQEYMYAEEENDNEDAQSVRSVASELVNPDITTPNGGVGEGDLKKMIEQDTQDKDKYFGDGENKPDEEQHVFGQNPPYADELANPEKVDIQSEHAEVEDADKSDGISETSSGFGEEPPDVKKIHVETLKKGGMKERPPEGFVENKMPPPAPRPKVSMDQLSEGSNDSYMSDGD